MRNFSKVLAMVLMVIPLSQRLVWGGDTDQDNSVTAHVTDKSGPMPGASVLVKGTVNGTVTDSDGNAVLILIHEHAENLCARENLNASFLRTDDLRIRLRNGCRVDDRIDRLDILRTMLRENRDSLLFEMLRDRGRMNIRSADNMSAFCQNLCNRRQTDAADAETMNSFILRNIRQDTYLLIIFIM